ncbi:MAG TPA: HlyD family efflux transporter periplasmic adaptor subunit [Lacipirellulaceae bacterium]|nr:HlyD family efflux transporter periplasmic adaptor subunit [Lacipirellulaceae bacterium]
MRRSFVPVLIVFAGSLLIARCQSTSYAAEKHAPAEKAASEAKNDSDKKDSKATSAKDNKTAVKKSDTSPAAKSEQKEGAKTTTATAKDKPQASGDKNAAKDEKKPAAKTKAEEKKRKTYKVEPKRLKIDISLDGAFVAHKMAEVPLHPKVWSDYEIVDVIDHGTKVHKGERLITFDDDKINDSIRDLELEQRTNDLTIMKEEEELPRLEKNLKLDFQDADRANQHAKEDFKRYNEVDRPMAIKSADFMVKFYNFMLDYEKDELHELEKMYKADDLTEETEEIVLKRQRNQVEFAEFSVEEAKVESNEMIKVRIPRTDIRMKEALDRASLTKARAQMALSLDLDRARYDLEQHKQLRAKSLDKHAKLLGDKELMEIKSPADGIVYYGQCTDGRWADTPSLTKRYKPHNNVTPDSVLMTIVQLRPLYVTSTLDEGKRPEVADGQKIKVALPAEGANRVGGEVKSISPIPVSTGKFEINFDLTQDQIPKWIVPGMSCKVSVNVYDKKDALVVPKKAVHDDKDDPDQHYVWLVDSEDEEAKPQRRNVKLGKRKDDEVEVLKGLKKGDVISLDDESEKAKDTQEKD